MAARNKKRFYRVTVGQGLGFEVGLILAKNGHSIIEQGFTDGSTSWSFVIIPRSNRTSPEDVQEQIWAVFHSIWCSVRDLAATEKESLF